MKDKVDELINRRLNPKKSYYINPLLIKITIILLLLLILTVDCIFD